MYRTSTSSPPGAPGDHPLDAVSLSALSRGRAVHNDYVENPCRKQPAADVVDEPTPRRPPSPAVVRRLEPRPRHHRNDVDMTSRRHRVPMPLPGSAVRRGAPMTSSSSSLPAHLVARSRLDDAATTALLTPARAAAPTVPPRPTTVGHMAPRRNTDPEFALRRPDPFVRRHTSSTPPPRPPRPSPELAARLGLDVIVAAAAAAERNRRADVILAPPRTWNDYRKAAAVDDDVIIKRQPSSVVVRPPSPTCAASKIDGEKMALKVVELIDDDDDDGGPRKERARMLLRTDLADERHSCPHCGKCVCERCMKAPAPHGPAPDAGGAAAPCLCCCAAPDDDARVDGETRRRRRCCCAPDACVEAATCLCCVRCCFYHCCASGDDADDRSMWADKPCVCRGPNCALRWSLLGLLAVALPCLCCYPPARGCLLACRAKGAGCWRPGCHCRDDDGDDDDAG